MIAEDFINCLNRQIAYLNAEGDRRSPPGDPYGGLMLYDDAELLKKLCELLAPDHAAVDPGVLVARAQFEAQANDSYGFKRSRRGTYVNGATARDWKWFRLGIDASLQATAGATTLDGPLYSTRQDAARWRESLMHVGAFKQTPGFTYRFQLAYLDPIPGADLFKGSVAQHFTEAIDAARANRRSERRVTDR